MAAAHPEPPCLTCDQLINEGGMTRVHVLLTVVVGVCWMADAMEVLLLSFIAPLIRCKWNLSSTDEALLTTVVFLGMSFGCYFWGFVSDRYGRRPVVMFSSLTVLIFGVACAFAPSFAVLVVLRCAVGFAIGGVPASFALLVEFSPDHVRGVFGIFCCCFWSLGSMLEAGLAWAVITSGLGWRWLVGLSAIPAAFIFALSPFLLESPRFYAAHGNVEKCREVLSKMKGAPVEATISVPPKEKTGQIGDLFRGGVARATLIQWVLWGVSAFTYYGVVLLTTQLFNMEDEGKRCNYGTHTTNSDTKKCTELHDSTYSDVFITASGELPGLLAMLFLIDKVGRKNVLIFGCAIQGLLCACLIPCTSRAIESAILFALRAVAVGVFQVAYVYTGEFYPACVRALALSTSSLVSRFAGMATPYVAQVVVELSMTFGLSLYAVGGLIAALFAVCLPYDTKNITMPESLQDLRTRLSETNQKDLGRKKRLFVRSRLVVPVTDNTPLNPAPSSS